MNLGKTLNMFFVFVLLARFPPTIPHTITRHPWDIIHCDPRRSDFDRAISIYCEEGYL